VTAMPNLSVDSDTLRQGAAQCRWKSCTVRPPHAPSDPPPPPPPPPQRAGHLYVRPHPNECVLAVSGRRRHSHTAAPFSLLRHRWATTSWHGHRSSASPLDLAVLSSLANLAADRVRDRAASVRRSREAVLRHTAASRVCRTAAAEQPLCMPAASAKGSDLVARANAPRIS
jgi:hypothetical protein